MFTRKANGLTKFTQYFVNIVYRNEERLTFQAQFSVSVKNIISLASAVMAVTCFTTNMLTASIAVAAQLLTKYVDYFKLGTAAKRNPRK